MSDRSHPIDVSDYPNGLRQLAADLSGLRYDRLSAFLFFLHEELQESSYDDEGRGRHQLARALNHAAEATLLSSERVHDAWSICKRYEINIKDGDVCPECGGTGLIPSMNGYIDWFTACGWCVNRGK